MKIVFMGTPDFSVPFLEQLNASEHDVICVVTQPDRPKGRSKKLIAPPVKVKALELSLPILQPESLKEEEFFNKMVALRADLLVVVAFSILPQKILGVSKFGAVNVHGSLLPKYRGAAPIQWAIANGETTTGVTIFRLDDKMDHGPVLEIEKCEIKDDENSEDIFNKLVPLGLKAIASAIKKIEAGDADGIIQDHMKASKAPKLKKNDGLINWENDSYSIHNLIRAFNPYPICFSYLEGKVFRIRKSKVNDELVSEFKDEKVGSLKIVNKKKLLVRTGTGCIEILELQLEGKKPMNPSDFINGLKTQGHMTLVNQV